MLCADLLAQLFSLQSWSDTEWRQQYQVISPKLPLDLTTDLKCQATEHHHFTTCRDSNTEPSACGFCRQRQQCCNQLLFAAVFTRCSLHNGGIRSIGGWWSFKAWSICWFLTATCEWRSFLGGLTVAFRVSNCLQICWSNYEAPKRAKPLRMKTDGNGILTACVLNFGY